MRYQPVCPVLYLHHLHQHLSQITILVSLDVFPSANHRALFNTFCQFKDTACPFNLVDGNPCIAGTTPVKPTPPAANPRQISVVSRLKLYHYKK